MHFEYRMNMSRDKSERISAVDAQNAWLWCTLPGAGEHAAAGVEVLHHAPSRAFSFTEDCFGREQEMILLVTGLTRNDCDGVHPVSGLHGIPGVRRLLLPEDTDEPQRQAEELLRSEQKERL